MIEYFSLEEMQQTFVTYFDIPFQGRLSLKDFSIHYYNVLY